MWLGTLRAGIHPTIAGVVLGLLTPVRPLGNEERAPVVSLQLLVGRHWLPTGSLWYGGPFFLDLRLDVGVGYAFTDVMSEDQPARVIRLERG